MWRDALFIARKDVQYTLRERETILWVFLMPVLFFYFIGTVTGGFRGPSPSTVTPLLVRGAAQGGFLAEHLVGRLEDERYRVVLEADANPERLPSRRLDVPEAFTDSVLAGSPTQLRFEHRAEGLGGDYESFRLGRAVYTLLADLILTDVDQGVVTPEGIAQVRDAKRPLSVEVTQAGERQRIPTGFEQAIPGTMVMFTLLVLATSGAILLVTERSQGLLRRLAYTPMSRGSIVLGKWLGKLVLGFVQIGFAMITGTVFFKMNWGPNLPMVLVLLAFYGGLMATLGLFLGSVARSEKQTAAIGVIGANVLGALGGCWWPIEITPAWMQRLQLFLPTGWAMDGLHKLVSFQLEPISVVPNVLWIAVATLVLLVATTRVFRFE